MARVYIVGTADTKGEELAYLRQCVDAAGAEPLLVDIGTRAATISVDVPATEVVACHPTKADEILQTDDRGVAMKTMGEAFGSFIRSRDDIAGVLAIGGGGGTSIATTGMHELPVGTPKLMVSTLASGDVGPYVGPTDITMMHSVTDFAGLNRISRTVLQNAAFAIVGMAKAPEVIEKDKSAIGLTMFGVTTPCTAQVVDRLKSMFDCLVFHATGTGGRAMEKLADSCMLSGIIDTTTTEVCDHLFGGVLSAGPDRFGAVARTAIPYVGSVGALDMINFWAPETIPDRYKNRNFYKHNPNVTLMRTTAAENRKIGAWIGARLNLCKGQVRFLVPERGLSALDIEGGVFFDPEADDALFDALETTIQETADRKMIRLPFHINDPDFSAALAENFLEIST